MVGFGIVVPVIPGRVGVEGFVRVFRDDLPCWNGERDGLVRFGGDLNQRDGKRYKWVNRSFRARARKRREGREARAKEREARDGERRGGARRSARKRGESRECRGRREGETHEKILDSSIRDLSTLLEGGHHPTDWTNSILDLWEVDLEEETVSIRGGFLADFGDLVT